MMKKSSSFLLNASPLPSDTNSPFTFAGIMKKNNISGSNIIDDRNQSSELFNVGASKKDESFLSLMDSIRLCEGSKLVQSTDMQQSL